MLGLLKPKPQRHVSEFVKRDRESKQRYARYYSPHRGQRFRFAGRPHEAWIRCPVTGAIMRERTYQARH